MKLEILQENLVKELSILQKALPSKPTLPILAFIHCKALGNAITLSATDLYLGIQTQALGNVIEEGECAIPGKLFYEVISALNPGKITLTLSELTLTIESADSKTSLQCSSSEEYPAFPQIEGTTNSLSWSVVESITSLVTWSVSSDVTRPVLTSLLFDNQDDTVSIVGTDGFRLAVWQESLELTSEQTKLLIPSKGWQELARAGAQQSVDHVDFVVSAELKQVLFQLGRSKVYLRLIDGDYPPYQKIIPENFNLQITFEGSDLAQHLKRAMVFARENSNIIHFEIDEEYLHIKATSPTAGVHESRLPVTHLSDLKTGTIAFNARYVLDYLNAIKEPRSWFGMNESLKPALFKPEGSTQYRYVVMPFRATK
jgi:DNA polymerase III subunit beta